MLVLLQPVFADAEEKVAIFYPQVREPYQTIYREIVEGVESSGQNLHQVILNESFDTQAIVDELHRLAINKVIVLGRTGYQLAKTLPQEFSVVSGALPIAPNGMSGVSLISDPANLFDYLREVAPQVSTIHVAYSEQNNWLIDIARQAASEKNLNLNAHKVESTGEAINFYNQLFESKVGRQDAVWLLLDRVSSHDKVTLPLILEKAWSQEVVVFSSKPSHAKRGALFSTYPDNFLLGKHLYAMVLELANKPEQAYFSPLQSMQLAVNLRTAAHLGLKYSSKQQEQFKVMFPE